jgi:beta-glucosidase
MSEVRPGLTLSATELHQVRHHAVRGHGLAVQAIRAQVTPGTRIDFAEAFSPPVPLIAPPEHIAAAEKAMRELNASFVTVMLEGRYTDAYLAGAGKDATRFIAEDLAIINSPLDFVGINVYKSASYVLAADEAPR